MNQKPDNPSKAKTNTDPLSEEKKPRIHFEQVKARHTSHWDWDYLPHSELEKLLHSSKPLPDPDRPDPSQRIRNVNLLTALLGMALGLAGIVAGIYYLSS